MVAVNVGAETLEADVPVYLAEVADGFDGTGDAHQRKRIFDHANQVCRQGRYDAC